MYKKNIKRDKSADAAIAFGIMFLIGLVMLIAAVGSYMLSEQPEYNRQVHAYIENARWSDDPKAIEENLTIAVQNMHNMGLTDNMYGELAPWSNSPASSMKNQYAQLDTQIKNAKNLQGMNITDYSYQPGLEKIHSYLYDENGWGDEVAQGAFTYGLNGGIVLLGTIGAILFFIGLFLGMACL